jgi:hypothetical protein
MELYDISVPSKEVEAIANNVAHLHPDIVEQMWQIIEQSHEDIDVPGFQVSVSRQ